MSQAQKIQAIADAVKANTDIVASIAHVTDSLAAEVKSLVAAANVEVPGLDDLLNEVKAQNVALSNAVITGTAAEGLVIPEATAETSTNAAVTGESAAPVVDATAGDSSAPSATESSATA